MPSPVCCSERRSQAVGMESRLVGSDAVTIAGAVHVVLKYDAVPAGIGAAHVVEDLIVQRCASMHGAVGRGGTVQPYPEPVPGARCLQGGLAKCDPGKAARRRARTAICGAPAVIGPRRKSGSRSSCEAAVPRRIERPSFRIVDDPSAGKLFSWTACAVLPRLGIRR